MITSSRSARARWLVEAFVVSNLAFLAVDIGVAHAGNGFRQDVEWLPIAFSLSTSSILLPGLSRWRSGAVGEDARGLVVGTLAVLLGVGGLLYHLASAFFVERTLMSLVYSAPCLAPLAYAGIGLLLILNRLERDVPERWAAWVLVLALGGFAGNFGLSLLDHAQNGFMNRLEWVPVGAAALATSSLVIALLGDQRRFLELCFGLCALEVLVGLAGFGLHLAGILRTPGRSLADRLLHGAPAFAPLLFADLGLLAAIAIWALLGTSAGPASSFRE